MCTWMAMVMGRKYSKNIGINLQKTKMQCKLRCGTQVRRSKKVFVIGLFFVLFLKMWSRGWGWGRCPLTNVADWKRRRGREALFWTSKWCTTRPPVRTTGQQIQLSPKQRNIFDGLQEINHPQGTTIPKIGNIVDENLRNKMDLYVYVLQSTLSSIIDSETHL